MTATTSISTGRQALPSLSDPAAAALEDVTFDLYRDVHKGLRAEIFAVTGQTGSVDPGDDEALDALAGRTARLLHLLDDHAAHEEEFLGPLIERVDPALVARIVDEHRMVEATMDELRRLSAATLDVGSGARRTVVRRLYVVAANFTSEYLAHLSTEEVEVMPALARAIPVDELLDVNGALISQIAPADLDDYMSIIVPAQSPDERLEMYAGMRTTTPVAVFEGWLALAATTLPQDDVRRLEAGLSAS